MRIVSQGENPYIKQPTCSTCKTVAEVDIRTDCKKEVVEYQEEARCWWETPAQVLYTWLRIETRYSFVCPVCSERIVAHREYDDSRHAEAQRKSRRRRY